MKINTLQDSGPNYTHPIPTFTDSKGRVCDEFGPIDVRLDSVELIVADGKERIGKWKDGVKKRFYEN